jgi:large subunit ribosomal protein L47
MNRNRGVSALRRTGLRYPVSVSKEPLPQPVLDPQKRAKPTIDPNHGLWEFFNKDKVPVGTPEEDYEQGEFLMADSMAIQRLTGILTRSIMVC